MYHRGCWSGHSQKQAKPSEDGHGFSADLGLVQPLFFTAMKCRDSDIRSAAIEMLDQCGTDKPFDAKVLAAISRRVIELEMSQDGLTRMPTHSPSDFVPERLRIGGCGPDYSHLRQVGDPQVTAFFSRCVDVSVIMAEKTPNDFEKSTHWQIWTETVTLGEAGNVQFDAHAKYGASQRTTSSNFFHIRVVLYHIPLLKTLPCCRDIICYRNISMLKGPLR